MFTYSFFLFCLCFLCVCGELHPCRSNQVPVQISRTYDINRDDETISLWRKSPTSGFLILLHNGRQTTSETYDITLCVERDIYCLVLSDGTKNGWDVGSRVSVKLFDSVVLVDSTLDRFGNKQFWIDCSWLSNPLSSWRYSDSYSADWNSASFDDSSWNAATAGFFPSISSSTFTRYYRHTSSFPLTRDEINQFAGFRLSGATQTGLICYVNGVEVLRENLPSGFVNHYTPSTIALPSPLIYSSSSVDTSLIFEGENVIACECHDSSYHLDHEDPFQSYVYLLPTDSRGFAYSLPMSKTYSGDQSADLSVLGDDDWRTSINIQPNSRISFVLPNEGEEFINAYSFSISPSSSPSSPTFTVPTAWTLEGSINSVTWTPLDTCEVNPTHFTNQKTFTAVLPYQFTAYPFYRIRFTKSVENKPFQLSEFQLLLYHPMGSSVSTFNSGNNDHTITSLINTSTLDLRYPSQVNALFPGQQNIRIQPSLAGFHSFTLQGALPEGLQFSSFTGIFSGALPTTLSSGYHRFTVTAKHAATGNTIHSTTVIFPVLVCNGMQSYQKVELRMQCTGASEGAFWRLEWQDSDLLYSQHCEDVLEGDSTVFTTTLCLQSSSYSLTLGSTRSAPGGWSPGTSLQVNLLTSGRTGSMTTAADYSIRLGEITLPRGKRTESFPLAILVASTGELSQWQYYVPTTIPDNWYQPASSTGWDFFPSSSSSLARSVWLFRHTFSVPNTIVVHSLDLEIWASPGLVIYLNGMEVYRSHVPIGPVQSQWVTTETGPSANAPSWHVIRLAVEETTLQAGGNLMAIAVVNANAQTRLVDFVFLAVAASHSSYFSRFTTEDVYHTTHSISDSDHLAGHSASLLLDTSLLTTYQARAGLDVYLIDLSTTSRRYEAVNQYCVTASLSHVIHDPLEWILQNGNGNDQWSSLHEVHGILFTPGERKCFVFTPTIASQLRLRVTSVRGASTLEMAEFGLYFKSIHPSSTVIPFQITSPRVSLYRHAFVITSFLADTATYQSFRILPSLPDGVFMDITTGRLFGTASTLMDSTTFTVEGTTESGGVYSQEVDIVVVDCDNSEKRTNLLTINVTGLKAGDQCTVLLENTAGRVLLETVHELPSRELHLALCVPSSMYSLLFITQLTDDITYSYSISNNNPHQGVIHEQSTLTTFSFNTEIPITIESTLWRYWLVASPAPTDWYQSGISETWSSSTVDSLPPVSGVTAYYCTTFFSSYSVDVSGFSVGAFVTGGVVMYLNGVEINRANLPEGEIHYHTLPLNTTNEPSTIVFSGSIQFLPFSVDPNGQAPDAPTGHNNRFCIEVHRPSQTAETNSFYAYMEFLYGESNRILDGFPWGSVGGVPAPWFEFIENAFDHNPDTKFFGPSECKDVIVRWTYNHYRKEYANYLRFYAGNVGNRRPLQLRLEGSNDLLVWTPLLSVSDLVWGAEGYGQWKEWMFNNTHAYRAYQLVGNECSGSQGIEFAEVILQTRRAEIACAAVDGFPSAMEGDVSYGPCPEYYSGQSMRVCQNGQFTAIDLSTCIPFAPTTLDYQPNSITVFTHSFVRFIPTFAFHVDYFNVYPSLPAGIQLNITTGVISGTPSLDSPLTTYTVVAHNERGEARDTITLYIKAGCMDISDFPATSVGSTEVYYCSRKTGMYGKVYRTCMEVDGVPIWSAPDGNCKSVFTSILFVGMLLLILVAVVGTWVFSESMNQQYNIYELPNGEYEMEEIYEDDGEEIEMEEMGEGYSMGETVEAPGTTHLRRRRERVKPRMKLLGRPVFIYIPRYFKKKRRDYNYMYHPAPKIQRNRV